MPKTLEGKLSPPLGRYAIVAARFNSLVVDSLISGALETFSRYGVVSDRIDVVRVPGSFEIPLVAQKLAETGSYVVIVCLGAVIRGDTDHYDHVAGAAASGIMQVNLKTGIPTIFGVLTCDNLEQALNRAGGKAGNKGAEAALAGLEMANLLPLITLSSA